MHVVSNGEIHVTVHAFAEVKGKGMYKRIDILDRSICLIIKRSKVLSDVKEWLRL